MTKKDYISIGEALRFGAIEQGEEIRPWVINALCRCFKSDNGAFKEERFRGWVAGTCGSNGGEIKKRKTPTLGPCSCKRGQERDNCANCEGTGMRIDFAALRARA
jgi:hypothetical protein